MADRLGAIGGGEKGESGQLPASFAAPQAACAPRPLEVKRRQTQAQPSAAGRRGGRPGEARQGLRAGDNLMPIAKPAVFAPTPPARLRLLGAGMIALLVLGGCSQLQIGIASCRERVGKYV